MKTNESYPFLIHQKLYDYKKNLLYIPENMELAPENCCGLSCEAYLEAANTFIQFIQYLLDCIAQDPDYYGMTCIPAENNDKANWNKTNTPFYKLTNTIQNMFNNNGQNGTQLDCRMSTLKAKLPRKFPHILELFESFGFILTGLDAKMKPEDGENFGVQYPANPDIFRVFHAKQTEQTIWNITNWGILAAREEDRIRYPLEFFKNHLEDASLHTLLTEMHALLSHAGISYQTGEENHILHNALRYKAKRISKELMDLRFSGGAPQTLSCKLRLSHIRQYESVFNACTDTIKQKILENKQCTHCAGCTTQIVMNYNGGHYVFCNPTFWWCPFVLDDLHDLTDADIQSVLSLISAELPYYLEG